MGPRLRALLVALVALGGLAAQKLPANAAYPDHPVRWLIGFTAGGPVDTVARIMAQFLSDRLGQTFSFDRHDTFLVGRSPSAHFRLPGKDEYFSRVHFLVRFLGLTGFLAACVGLVLARLDGLPIDARSVTEEIAAKEAE